MVALNPCAHKRTLAPPHPVSYAMSNFVRTVLILALVIGALFWTLTQTRAGQHFVLTRMTEALMTQAAQPREPTPGLRVFMCGTSSPLAAIGRAQACVSVEAGGKRFLVDVGAGSPEVLGRHGENLRNLHAIVLTHFHSDHIAALADLNLGSWVAGRDVPLMVYGGEGVDQVANGFNMAYAQDSVYRTAHHGSEMLPPELSVMGHQAVSEGTFYDEDGLRISAISVEHDPVQPALAYKFEYADRTVVISGDTLVTHNMRANVAGADLLLHDALSTDIVKALELAAKKAGNTRHR